MVASGIFHTVSLTEYTSSILDAVLNETQVCWVYIMKRVVSLISFCSSGANTWGSSPQHSSATTSSPSCLLSLATAVLRRIPPIARVVCSRSTYTTHGLCLRRTMSCRMQLARAPLSSLRRPLRRDRTSLTQLSTAITRSSALTYRRFTATTLGNCRLSKLSMIPRM